jgi:hypothetical protein
LTSSFHLLFGLPSFLLCISTLLHLLFPILCKCPYILDSLNNWSFHFHSPPYSSFQTIWVPDTLQVALINIKCMALPQADQFHTAALIVNF